MPAVADPSRSRAAPLAPLALLVLAIAACGGGDRAADGYAPGGAPPAPGGRAAVRDTGAVADDGQWTMASKDHANTRYSGLADIDASNVRDLRLAWSFSTGVLRGHEAAPLVVGSTMYVVTPFPNTLYALDLAKDGALKWKYDPGTSRAS